MDHVAGDHRLLAAGLDDHQHVTRGVPRGGIEADARIEAMVDSYEIGGPASTMGVTESPKMSSPSGYDVACQYSNSGVAKT